MAARRRRLKGFFPWLGRWLVAGAWQLTRHPHLPIAGGLLAVASMLVWQAMRHTDLFRVTRIELPAWPAGRPDGSPLIPPPSSIATGDAARRAGPVGPLEGGGITPPASLLQRNIWDVNLRIVAEELGRQHPALKEVRVIRELPHVIRIEPVWRVPVAQLRLERQRGKPRWHLVDREGVVWPDGDPEPVERVIRVVGVGPGTRDGLPEDEIRLAVRVVQRVDLAAARLAPRVVEINVADPREIRLILESNAVPAGRPAWPAGRQVEVRCGAEADLEANLQRLEASLRALDRHVLLVNPAPRPARPGTPERAGDGRGFGDSPSSPPRPDTLGWDPRSSEGRPWGGVKMIDVRFPEPVIVPQNLEPLTK